MNKKIIFVILLFIGISFIVYSFANPITNDDENNLAQSGISEKDKSNYKDDDNDLDNSDIVEKKDDDSLKDDDEKKDDDNEENNVSSSTSSTTNIVKTKPTSSNQYKKPSTSTGSNTNRVPSSNVGNNTNTGNNNTSSGGNTGNNGGNTSGSGNNGGTINQPTQPDPIKPEPEPEPIKPVVETTVTSTNPNITVKSGNSKNELYLSGQLQAETYRDSSINDVFEVYKISLRFVPSDSSIVGKNVTYRFSKTMGLRGELKKASLNNDKSFNVDLIINANLFNSSKSLIVYIDWNDENGETAYTINLSELRTN